MARGWARRLAARLRSRASLRQKRSHSGTLDVRKVMRHNMRYGGVPVELKYHTKQVKPRLVLICDVSTSMRYCAEFLLTLVYELQDVVAKTDSFIFIDDLVDISMTFEEKQPQEAVSQVLYDNPPGYYSTDLGNSLMAADEILWEAKQRNFEAIRQANRQQRLPGRSPNLVLITVEGLGCSSASELEDLATAMPAGHPT